MKEKIFINHTNHPSTKWQENQRTAAEKYGRIIDMGFPMIPPEESSQEVRRRAMDMAEKISAMHPEAVLCQGEYGYTFAFVDSMLSRGVKVLTACSERVVREWLDEEGCQHRDAVFQFYQFREYLRSEKA